MTCYHPIPAFRTPHGVVFSALRRHDIRGEVKIPCGQCIGCRLRRARDWSIRIMHEASLYDHNCFITLTYDDENLPENGHLQYSDFQAFMRRLRKRGFKPRFFMCGEYGPTTLRPHYHACMFNLEFVDQTPIGKSASGFVFYDSPLLRSIWGKGHVTVQPLTKETAAYTARYVVDKVNGDAAEKHYSSVDSDGVITRRPAEFSHCSLKPGIGARWFERYGNYTYRHDHVIIEGAPVAPPKYYDKLFRRVDKSVRVDTIEFEREKRARSVADDNTADRLAVREIVARARIVNQKRKEI